jgi:hypothetical protein
MHWVARQNKLELPNDEEEVNTRDIHKCDGQAHKLSIFYFLFSLFFLPEQAAYSTPHASVER